METSQAIDVLTTESLNLGVELNIKSNLKAALEIAVQQLRGTLQTQLADLEETKAELATAQDTIATLQPAEPVAEPLADPIK